jgi:hypothetical protein
MASTVANIACMSALELASARPGPSCRPSQTTPLPPILTPAPWVASGHQDGDDAVEETGRLKQSLQSSQKHEWTERSGLGPETWAAPWDLGRSMPSRLRFVGVVSLEVAEATSRSWHLNGCGQRRGRRLARDLKRNHGAVEVLGRSHGAGQILWAAVPVELSSALVRS